MLTNAWKRLGKRYSPRHFGKRSKTLARHYAKNDKVLMPTNKNKPMPVNKAKPIPVNKKSKAKSTSLFTPFLDPFSDIFHLRSNIDNAFDQFFGDFGNTEFTNPRLEIKETDKQFVVAVELPGIKKEDIKISLKGDSLQIEGEVKKSTDVKDEKIHRSERLYGKIFRRIRVPEDIKKDSIQAKFEDGILLLTVDKPEKKPETKEESKIEIK